MEWWKMEDDADRNRWEKPIPLEDLDNGIAAVAAVGGVAAAFGVFGAGGYAYLAPY